MDFQTELFPIETLVLQRDFGKSVITHLQCKTQIATARHQQNDGQSERTIRTVKEMLRGYLEYNVTNWDQDLALVEFAYDDSVGTSAGFSPFI